MSFFPTISPPSIMTLRDAITEAGLSSSLKLCLDAGDVQSFGGSGNSWLDRSGNGYDFFLGSASSTSSDDPTFNGSAGALTSSEYFSFDGGDFFTYDTTNETWMNNLHKDNAAFTILAIIRPVNAGGLQPLFSGIQSAAGLQGIEFSIASDEKLGLLVGNTAAGALAATSDGTVSVGSIQALAISINEAAGAAGGFLWNNGSYMQRGGADTWNPAYSSPSSGNADGTYKIGRRGADAGAIFESGVRLYGFAIWEGAALSKANLDAILDLTRSRWDI